MSDSESSSSSERGEVSAWDRYLEPADVRRGMRLLAIMTALALIASVAASIAFATGHFDDHPYSWF